MFKRFKKDIVETVSSRDFANKAGGDTPIIVDYSALCITAFLNDITEQKQLKAPPPPPQHVEKVEFKALLDKIDFSGKNIH